MFTFVYSNPVKIIFGLKVLERVGEEAKALGTRALIVVSRGGSMERYGYLKRVITSLEENGVSTVVFREVLTNPPIEVIDRGAEVAAEEKCDLIIGLGGGSSIDTAKIISILAVNRGSAKDVLEWKLKPKKALPLIAIPTTHGTGTEVDRYAVLSDYKDKVKKGFASRYIYPKVALLDPELTVTLPPRLSAATTVDALAHALEAYVSRDTNALARLYASEAIRVIAEYGPLVLCNPRDVEVRTKLLWASMMAGFAIDISRTALGHAMEHAVSALYPQIHHGEGLAVILPVWAEYTYKAAKEAFAEIAVLLGEKTEKLSVDEAAQRGVKALADLIFRLRLETSFGKMGVKEDDVEILADIAFKHQYYNIEKNPCVPSREELKRLFLKCI